MARYIAGRLLALVPVVLLVSVAAFSFIHLLPGDPVIALLGTSGQSLTPQQYQARRHDLGLDQPLPEQYLKWAGHALTGDLGRSAVTHKTITQALRDRFPITLQLTIASFVISLLIALPAGIVAAYRRNSLLDRVMTIVALAGVAIPSFWLGILMILLFAVEVRWLPPSGWVSFGSSPGEWLRHLLMPALALGVVQAAVVMRQVRSSLLEVLNEDFVRTARAKGLAERRVVLQHAMRNALLPVVTVAGLQVSRLLGGAVIIETVFALPGFGSYSVASIFNRDYPVVQAVVLVTAVIVVLTNLFTDLLYGVLDPRIRYA